jgi:hypothetical protein
MKAKVIRLCGISDLVKVRGHSLVSRDRITPGEIFGIWVSQNAPCIFQLISELTGMT